MSTKSSWRDLAGPRVHVRDVPRVASGSPAKFLLQCELYQVAGPDAALALAKRHISLRDAHDTVTRLFDHGEAVVDLPMVESIDALTHDLAACNVTAKPFGPPLKVDVK